MKLTLGFSPCPNDTFIFDALASGKIDGGDLQFDVLLEDVQTLNEWALEGRLDITKLSFPALFQSPHYRLLSAGAALGRGVGPLLVSAKPMDDEIVADDMIVALPGANTTANLLFQISFPNVVQRRQMLFSDIENAVLKGDADLGVLIHENRFTYAERGLHLVCDLGSIWEQITNVPIPLGAIAIRKEFSEDIVDNITRLIRESLAHAWKNYPQLPPFVRENAQEMSEEVMRQHINLYVNDYSVDLGDDGMSAVESLRLTYHRQAGT